jgi:hypothetical protein
MLQPNSRVVIRRPRFTQGGKSVFQDKLGRLESITGRYCIVVLDGELDELGFFVDELDEVC